MSVVKFRKAHLLGQESPVPVTRKFLKDLILGKQIYFRYFLHDNTIIDLIL